MHGQTVQPAEVFPLSDPATSLPLRHQVPRADTWDLESIYPTPADWEQDFARLEAELPRLAACQGTLGRSGADLLGALQLRDETGVRLGKLLVYAELHRDEDTANSFFLALCDRAQMLQTRYRGATAFFEPELLALPPATLARCRAEAPGLALYDHYLADLFRQQAHVLAAEVEELLARAGDLAQGPETIFAMLNNADMRFPVIRDADGRDVELTQGRFIPLLASPDRRVRREVFAALYGTYRRHLHTLAATLAASVKKDVFFARARRYSSALAAALGKGNIPASVYHNLIRVVNDNLPLLHRYLRLRRRLLGLDELRMYDLYTPLVAAVDRPYPWPEAKALVTAALAPLGAGYVATVRHGLENRWVDVYENRNKRSGAYSWGSYATQPFILLNYDEKLDGVFTLAHELGHSLHSYYTRTHQPPVYGDYTIFVAEVASTLNEHLLSHHLLAQNPDRRLRLYLLNQQLESFRTTLFRQTLFAEFELLIHTRVEQNEPLTAEVLCRQYYDLNQKYYGAEAVVDPEIELEWARIPHFYTAFYVYQYATGLAAATALAQQVLTQGQPAVDRYLGFLMSGSSDYPINLLQGAGVDMTSPAPVQQALDTFAARLEAFAALALG